ncbi:uncharacterized protein LAJ45_03438 [Morchella importuna]|uniref:uncharacterized protein n=1 Tax=Morchella importuna TaxID=1174673 RepID=UPI001E8D48D7|nr:uncharacterized protein LAJ45_03438 [Morchella importuna]KAH8152597.1 hypothetical protein LAJ45_03438 [Morchella importuna]
MRSPPTRTGASESAIAPALLVAPQARESRSSREDTLISRAAGAGAGAGVGIGTGMGLMGVGADTIRVAEGEGGEETKQEPTFIADNDQNPHIPRDSGYEPGPAEPVRSGTIFNNPGHIHITDYGNPSEAVSPTLIEPEPLRTHEQTLDTVAADENRNSPPQLRNELCRNSSDDSQTSDYSNHSITQSLNPNSRPTSKVYYGQRYDGDLRKQRFPPKSTTAPPETAGPSRPLPRPPLGVVPSFINTQNVDTGPKVESLINEPAREYNGISASETRGGQENEYVYSRAGAKEEEQRYRNPGRETSAETTSIHQETLDPVIHTVIRPVENEEITTVITREIHHTEIHPIVQPIVDIERLPKKHYLETPNGNFVEITAEEAERQGWEEVWRGDLVPDERNESSFMVRDTGEAKNEEVQRRMPALELEQRNKATPRTVNISHTYEEGVYEPYGNGDIMGDNGRKASMPLPLEFGVRTGSSERVKTPHGPESYTERNVLVGPAY